MEIAVTESVEQKIKFVAVYLRKSRSSGDEEEDLVKHKRTIEEHCENRGWKYLIYPEIRSGSDIENRPEMKKMLNDVQEGLFDAVFVFSEDRLGRGGSGDQEKILLTLKHSETLLVTANPFKIYDMNDESDETLMDVHGFVAKMEYKQIRKRMSAGKKIGLKMGRWVHGSVPYGYSYNDKLKKLDINEEEKENVRFMVESYLNGKSTPDICWELNRKRIPSPRGRLWKPVTITRIFKSKVYLGHVVGNKSEGNGGKNRTSTSKPFRHLPESEWVVVRNCHKSIISEEEQQKLLKLLGSDDKPKYNNKVNIFTGLIKCGKCGKNIHHKEMSSGDGVANCECGNMGGSVDLIESAIFETAINLKDKLNEVKEDEIKNQKEDQINSELSGLEKELDKQDQALERIEEAYEAGMYDVNKARRKMEERQQEKWTIEKEILQLRKQLTSTNNHDSNERISKIDKFINEIHQDINSEKKNLIYKELISDIVWYKPTATKVDVTVNFL